jgi:outer membrane protein W
MKNTIKAGVVGLGIAAVAVVGLSSGGTGTAHADAYDFTADMTNLGMSNDYGAAAQVRVGVGVCQQLNSGWTPNQAVHDLWLNSQLSLHGSYQLVDTAIRDLCPWNSQPWGGYPTPLVPTGPPLDGSNV